MAPSAPILQLCRRKQRTLTKAACLFKPREAVEELSCAVTAMGLPDQQNLELVLDILQGDSLTVTDLYQGLQLEDLQRSRQAQLTYLVQLGYLSVCRQTIECETTLKISSGVKRCAFYRLYLQQLEVQVGPQTILAFFRQGDFRKNNSKFN